MTGTERKRQWRAAHPAESARAERERAQARRSGYWNELTLGCGTDTRRPCASAASYARYESSLGRCKQRMFWPRYGAGTGRMSPEEFRAAGDALSADAVQALGRMWDLPLDELKAECARMLTGWLDEGGPIPATA
jgi:hypothetical protein